MQAVRQAHTRQQIDRILLDFGARPAFDPGRRNHHVVDHGHVLEQVVLLEHNRDVQTQRANGHPVGIIHLTAIQTHTAMLGLQQPHQDTQQRALARPRRSDQADNLALLDGQVDTLQYRVRTVGGFQVNDFELRQDSSPGAYLSATRDTTSGSTAPEPSRTRAWRKSPCC